MFGTLGGSFESIDHHVESVGGVVDGVGRVADGVEGVTLLFGIKAYRLHSPTLWLIAHTFEGRLKVSAISSATYFQLWPTP